MTNSLTKVEAIAWEKACEAFEANNIFAQNAEVYKPSAGYAEQAGQTVRIPYANQIESSTGLDTTGQTKDIIDVTVPISLAASDIKNSKFAVTAIEGNFERRVSDNMKAAVRKLSSDVSTEIANKIIDEGALVGTKASSALTSYSDFAKAGTILDEIEAYGTDRFMYLPPRMAQGLANDLGMRATDNNRDHMAYTDGRLPNINDFNTFKTNALKTVSGSSASGVTVNGANQNVTVVAYQSDVTPSSGTVNDPRYSTLTVSASHGLVAGDVITIAGVNRVGVDSKTDTGQLMTFRVKSVDTNDLTVSPAIISSGAYQNVSAAPANSAAVTVRNTADAQPAVFTTKEAVNLFCSDLNFSLLEGSNQVVLDTYTSSSGLSIAFIRWGDGDTTSTNHRLTVWCKPNVVDPLKCGILLPSQALDL